MYSAIVFDMDGTLLDSERIAWDGFVATCAQFDLPAEFARYCRCIGSSGERSRAILSAQFGPDFPAEAFFAAWQSHYVSHAIEQPVAPKPGVVELLGALAATRLPLAVATSTRHAAAQRKLANAGLLDLFAFVIGGDQVARSKPAPEIFLRASARLGLPPSACLAVEDSENGLLAAHRAGCATALIPDLVPLAAAVAAHANVQFASMTGLHAHLQPLLRATHAH